MKKYHNNRLFTLFCKFKNLFKLRASTLIYKLSKKEKLKPTQNTSLSLPYIISGNKNRDNMEMDTQIETIEIIDGGPGNNNIVIIKLSNPEMMLESQNNSTIDSFDKQLNVLIPFPSSTRIH